MLKARNKVLKSMWQNKPIAQTPLTDKDVVTREEATCLDVMTYTMSENSIAQLHMHVTFGIEDYDRAIDQTRMNRLKKGIGK